MAVPPLPLQTFPSRYAYAVHDMPFILPTLSMDQEVIILKQHFCILMPYKQ